MLGWLGKKCADEVCCWLFQNLLSRSDLLEAPLMENGDPISQGEGFENVVRHENDCLLQPLLEGEHLLLKRVACQCVERAKGLVHQKVGRIGRQGPRHPYPLLLTAREFFREATGIGFRVKTDDSEKLMSTLPPFLLRPTKKTWHHGHVLLDRHVGEQADSLEDVSDPAAQGDRILIRNVLAVHLDRAGGGFEEAVYQLQKSGLAAAGGTEENKRLSL